MEFSTKIWPSQNTIWTTYSMSFILYSFDPQNQIFNETFLVVTLFFLDWTSNSDVFVLNNGNKTFMKLFYFKFCTSTLSLDFFRFPDLEFKVSKISRDILEEQFGMILQIGSGPNVITLPRNELLCQLLGQA